MSLADDLVRAATQAVRAPGVTLDRQPAAAVVAVLDTLVDSDDTRFRDLFPMDLEALADEVEAS
ncbi:MAG: hypothetical protein ACRDO8_13350 [Nocardioidaceae bacterium]